MIVTSALELARQIKEKQLSPLEALDHYLKQVDRHNASLNCFVWRRDDEARKEARALETQLMRTPPADLPPFFGVPLPIKDLTEVLGEPVTHGSRAAQDKVGRYDATVISQLRKAGFLFMGRTNSPEFGTLPVTENTRYGATRNPWDLTRTPGGSSGGAAAAVAAGMAPIAHASDGGGSIRIPASCCGLVGLKPSRGRVPKGPMISEIMHGISADLCVSSTVADTAALLDATAHFDRRNWYGLEKPAVPFADAARRGPGKLRIGFTVTNAMDVKPEPSCIEAVTKTATILSSLGHEVFEAQIDWTKSYQQQGLTQGCSEFDGLPPLGRDFITLWCTAAAYMEFGDWSIVEPLNLGLRELAQQQSSFAYIKALVRLQLFARHVTSYFERDFDVLLTPTLAMEPPKIGWLYATGETDPVRLLWRCTEMVPYNGWCNVTGQPAISVPMHMTKKPDGVPGLPIGVQLVGAPYGEATLLALAQQLEDATQWQDVRPELPST